SRDPVSGDYAPVWLFEAVWRRGGSPFDHSSRRRFAARLNSGVRPHNMITADRIQKLHDKYLELIRLETLEFGVKPTEVRHLIGRLGEFHCALQVGGKLAHLANQHGFDVVCSNDRRISVKTTAQVSGFVSISKSTLDRVDDLMVVQFLDGNISTVYFGPVGAAVAISRFYEPSGCYELDISKARRLTAARTAQTDR
ncbi:DUF6998 domain-containing protein, partial [Pseudofulvimonas gallinarii]